MIRVGIAGFGFMGRMHYQKWRMIPGARVVAVQDIAIEEVRKKLTVKGNVAGAARRVDFDRLQLFSDFDEMIADADLDAVSITVPTFLHADLTVRALAAGLHVLCEKPMALTVAQCDRMIAEARQRRRILQVAHCIRFWPEYVKAREIVKSGKYGKVLAAGFRRFASTPAWVAGNWFADERRSGGMALDLHIHDTDFIQYLFGMPKAVVSTTGGNGRYIETQYLYGRDMCVSAEGGWVMAPSFGFEMSFNIALERAAIQYDIRRKPVFCLCAAGDKPVVPRIESGDGYSREIEHFAGLIEGKRIPLVITPMQSRESIRIVLAERKSAARGCAVHLE